MANKKPSSAKKIVYWVIAILVFYIFTTARASTGIVEVTQKVQAGAPIQQTVVVEKIVKTTKYNTTKVPFGVPRCEQMNYNYSFKYSYTETFANNQKNGTCTFVVRNEEDIAGDFTFSAQLIRPGKISDAPEQKKTISANGTNTFEWSLSLDSSQTLSCLLQAVNPPHRQKCFYLEPITYQIKEVPYVVEELKNVTETRLIANTTTSTIRQNVTKNIYTNRFFGYKQFFYLGY